MQRSLIARAEPAHPANCTETSTLAGASTRSVHGAESSVQIAMRRDGTRPALGAFVGCVKLISPYLDVCTNP